MILSQYTVTTLGCLKLDCKQSRATGQKLHAALQLCGNLKRKCSTSQRCEIDQLYWAALLAHSQSGSLPGSATL